MPAARQNLVIDQGATFKLTIIRYTDASKSTVVNLTSHNVGIGIKKAYDNEDYTYAANSAELNSHITIDGNLGKITWEIPHAITGAFPAPFDGIWELRDTDAAGVATRLLEGRLVIRPGVIID